MALEACFQLTPAATRTSDLHAQNPRNLKLLPIKRALPSPTFIQLPSRRRNAASETCSIICRTTNAVDEVLEVSDNTWKEVIIKNKVPVVVVDFWAPSCGPCKMVAPVMDELAKEYVGKIACYKINTDENLKMATRHGIRSIPTILIFKNGELVKSVTGLVKKGALCAIIDEHL